MKHRVLLFLSFVFFTLSAGAQTAVPDFKVETVSKTSELNGWMVFLTPPAKHHFNIKAPMKATIAAKQIDFIVQDAKEPKIIFERANAAIEGSDTIDISVFLCDDAKTFCIKKTKAVVLSSVLNPSLETTPIVANGTMGKSLLRAKPPQRVAQADRVPPADQIQTHPDPEGDSVESVNEDLSTATAQKKDAHGFWDNNIPAALHEAKRMKKPLLIDFYGIWCPPCNQFNESVFPTAKFQTAAKHFVMLNIDADKNESWEMKSHFKVGGYPTIIFAKVPGDTTANHLEEIDRLVGFFNADETVKNLNEAYANRTKTLTQKMGERKSDYLELLKKQIEVKIEQKDFAEVQNLADEGNRTNPNDLYFRIVKVQAQGELAASAAPVAEKPETLALLKEIWENRASASVETLLHAEDFTVQNADHFKPENGKVLPLAWALDLINTLSEKVDPKTLIVDGYELSIADLDGMRMDVYEAQKDDEGLKKARVSAIASYQKLIAYFGKKEPRGLNLELAYLLRKNGQINESKALYDRFLKKYPHEFTFNYAASKLYLEIKDLPKARELAENAVKYGYGDNQLRAEDTLLQVMQAQGEKETALKRGKEFLAQAKDPKGYAVRTQRYLSAIQKTLKEIEASK